MKKKSLLYGLLGLIVKNPGAISAGLVRFGKVTTLAGVAALIVAPFWKEGLTELGFVLVIAILAAFEKFLKEKWGAGLALALVFLLPQPANAQTIQLEVKDALAIGGGSMLSDEAVTFSADAAFAAVQWHGLSLFNENGSTGIGAEINPAAVASSFENGVSVQFIDSVSWRLWSLNRVKMSVLQLPGEIWDQMYLGADALVYEGGSKDFTGDFTARFVYGVREGPLQVEIYMFEKYRPISVALLYRF